MAINLSPNIESIIKDKVKSGLFKSADDVLFQALALLDKHYAYKMYVEKALQEGADCFERGEFYTQEQVKQHMNKVFKTIEDKA
jgi:antitoxin ParD1/3/4